MLSLCNNDTTQSRFIVGDFQCQLAKPDDDENSKAVHCMASSNLRTREQNYSVYASNVSAAKELKTDHITEMGRLTTFLSFVRQAYITRPLTLHQSKDKIGLILGALTTTA